jgi:hypothetical protein
VATEEDGRPGSRRFVFGTSTPYRQGSDEALPSAAVE